MTDKIVEENNKTYISCIGVDNKIHVCEPHENVTKCGVKIKTKKTEKNDCLRYSCYECTY